MPKKSSSSRSRWVDFKRLKSEVSMAMVLAHYDIELAERGQSHRGACPLHEGENPTSLSVDLDGDRWHCFACKKGGNVLDFVVAAEGLSLRDAALKLCEWFSISHEKGSPSPPPERKTTSEKPSRRSPASTNAPLTFELKLEPSDYLQERGLSEETISVFGLGLSTRGVMKDRIAIPIHNRDGELVGYAGRWPGAPPEGEPKYRFPDGFRKSLEVFNLHRLPTSTTSVVLVEGFFDLFRLRQLGIENAVAAMGSSLSDAQSELLVGALGSTGQVDVLFDADEAGREGAADTVQRLSRQLYVRELALPESVEQPEHLTSDQLSQLFG